jgi:hypothetical protein
MEHTMQIFQQEYDDGIADAIRATARITYASLVEPCKDTSLSKVISHMKTLSALNDQDLYYVQSILVTSNWNKNDDIFDKSEIWAARNTPEDKPTNLEHDESLIIGHITANWPITGDGILIDENTPVDNLPDKFHILTGSVIYRAFSKPELKERAEKLIAEIENGQKYVSMECLFKGFDYGLMNKTTGEYKILSRDNNTAYLTKYLRSYGGAGEHEQYKIGRVLRNITFSGKGFVDKPANPESIIFTKNELNHIEQKNISSEKNINFIISGVSNIDPQPEVENINMNLETEIADIKTKIESLASVAGATDCSGAVKEAYASVSAAENTIKELNDSVKAGEEALTQTRAEIEALRVEKEEAAKKMRAEMDMKEEEMKKMKAELDSALETIAAYKGKEEKMMKAEKKMKRMAALIENGVESEVASSTVDKFESLDDEAFDAIAALLAAKKPPMKEEMETEEAMMKKKAEKMKEEEAMMMKKRASEDNLTDPEVLEAAEVAQEVNLGIGGETENSVENTRAALVEFVSSRLGKKL